MPVTDEVIADINYMLMYWYDLEEIDESSYLDMAFYEKEIEAATWDDVGFLKTGDMIKANYGTSVDTYMSFGPYKLVSFQADKEYRLTRNENWYGWTDGKHEGQFQTTDIVYTVVEETATKEQLFLQGKLDYLLLTADTLRTYQGSDYIAYSGNPYIYFLNINNDEDLLTEREEPGINKTILTYLDFRKGISLSMNRSDYVAQQGFGKALYGYISDYFVADVDTGERYRDTDPALETLKTFYGVDDVDEITGYDLDAAKQYLVAGYEQALAIVGESGSGKSVTARSIMGILAPNAVVDGGSILYEDVDLLKLKEEQFHKYRGNKLGMVFQDPLSSLNPIVKIGKQLTESMRLNEKISKKDAKKRALELLAGVGISDPERRYDQYPFELSGGMRQRVVIAIALSANPEVLICDEPTTALDVTIQAQVINLLGQLRDDLGLTILFIAHDLSVVKYFSDRIGVMYFSHLVELAGSDELFARPLHGYTKALLSAIPLPDPNYEKNRRRITYQPPELTEEEQAALELREIFPGHFVRCTPAQAEQMRKQA